MAIRFLYEKKAPPPASNSKAVIIDARSAGYEGDPIRILAVVSVATGKVMLRKPATWHEQPTPKDDTIVVTDTPAMFHHWGLSFTEKQDMQAVIAAYKASKAARLIQIHDSLQMYDPDFVMQTRKVDERGQVLEFDSMGLNNGHMAMLLAIWSARFVHGGYVVTRVGALGEVEEGDNFMAGVDDNDTLPFSV